MEKIHHISDLRFENDHLILEVDNQTINLKLTDISEKLAKASDTERSTYTISPSEYGIHWKLLDEDLSVNGLLRTHKTKQELQHHF